MKVFLRGDRAVPIIIAKRYVKTEPKISKIRRFVGFKQGFGTLLYKTIELVQECFWDIEETVEDRGESEVVNYIIDISDDPGAAAPELVVTRLHGKARPGCGFYCEVISPHPITPESEDTSAYTPAADSDSGAKMIQPKKRRPDHVRPLPPPEAI